MENFMACLLHYKIYNYYIYIYVYIYTGLSISYSFKQGLIVFDDGQRPDNLFFLRQYRELCKYMYYC